MQQLNDILKLQMEYIEVAQKQQLIVKG